MPKIGYTREVSPLALRSNSPLQTRRADPAAFGAPQAEQAARSAQQTLDAAGDVFDVQERERERRRKEEKAVAIGNFDWTKQELELRKQVGPDAEDLQDRIRTGYQEYVDDYVDGIENDVVRTEVKTALLSDLPNVTSRAAQYTYTTQQENSKARIDDSLNGIQNKINTDPTQFDKYRQEGDALIDAAPNTTAAQREGMKYAWKYDAAKRRFDGRINTVKSVDDIDAISAELVGGEGQREWQKEMMPADFESLLNTLGTMRKTFNDRNNTDARALLTDLEGRQTNDTSLIPVAELQQAQELAKKTDDKSIAYRMGRLMRSQEIIRTEGRLTPAELQARINAANGNPGLTYPNLPVEVSDNINEVSQISGVSASYLGATANREYGSEFAKAKKQKSEDAVKFKPISGHKDVDLRNVRSDVVDAVTAAGRVYGAPLTMTAASGGSALSKNAVNIATPGMNGADKAKIASALVDAGFTGIAEYDGYIQADTVAAVPTSFGDKEGKVWGGWTYLSPEVAKTLKDKGFVAGADATAIQRAIKPTEEGKVNYAAPTGIQENGKPTSSAVGLYQFIESTWINTVKKPGFAETVGIDISKMDDKQILALRSNPRIQTFAAAALAKENKSIMENSLGREIDEAELYMGHFMGPTAATTFLTAYATNKDQSAANLLPQTAAANAPVFYADPKTKKIPLTVAQVYNGVAQTFGLAPSRVAYGDNEVRKKMLANMQKTLNEHPIEHAMSSGSHVISPLQEGFSKRGTQARAVAEYFNLPMKTMKPFTTDEEQYIKTVITDGTVDENIQLFADIQSMGPEIGRGALEQIGVKDTVFAHAGSMYLDGDRTTAGDIVRGRKRMQENPDLAKQVGASDNTALADAFGNEAGEALMEIAPEEAQAIQESARALYVERMATSRGNTTWSDKVFKEAIHDVLGKSLADVNGAMTLLPKGIDNDTMETALQRMTIQDWTAMSENGKPPQYAGGGIVNPEDIRDEAMLRAIGDGQYKIMLDDGTYLTTGERTPDNSRLKVFIFKPDVDKLVRASNRPAPRSKMSSVDPSDFGRY